MPTPAASQATKYPIAITHNETPARLVFKNVGNADGNIIATIMASHINRNTPAELAQGWPRIGIHIMDIVQPPGMFISQHIERQKYTVAEMPPTNTSTQTAMNSTGSGASAPPA